MADRVPMPEFRSLTRQECETLLRESFVGRIAFARSHRVDIVPLHYVFSDGIVCARTAPGTRLEQTSQSPYASWPAAFEVDQVEALFRWRSVVVHGSVRAAAPGTDEWARDAPAWEDAARRYQSLMPEAFTDGDPTRFRCVLLRMEVAEMSGREASPGLPERG